MNNHKSKKSLLGLIALSMLSSNLTGASALVFQVDTSNNTVWSIMRGTDPLEISRATLPTGWSAIAGSSSNNRRWEVHNLFSGGILPTLYVDSINRGVELWGYLPVPPPPPGFFGSSLTGSSSLGSPLPIQLSPVETPTVVHWEVAETFASLDGARFVVFPGF